MNAQKLINHKKASRVRRTRAKIAGTAARPRLAVFRSNVGIYAQLIDDAA
ncbi:MAG: 50S ribosomal protein L18, partial [Patescibacteria group bacterium]